MNRVKHIMGTLLIALPVMLLFAGCEKFLDRKPLSATLDDLNQGGLEGQVYGLYGAIRNGDVAGQGFGGIPWLAMNGFRADDSEKGSSAADGADWGVIYDKFQYVKDHWSSTTYWDQHYVLIGQANTALQTADSLNLTDDASRVNIAEARFFRAFAYFDLVRAFGEVPKIDYRVYNPSDARRPKASVAEIYTLIDSDLNEAIANLPVTWPAKYKGRLVQAAAKALHAKTMLYRQNWSGAFGLTQQIILSGQFKLLDDFSTVFKEAGENGAESVWEIQAYIGPNGIDNYFSWYGIAQGIRGSGDWDLGWGWNTPTQSLADAYGAGDKRKDVTIQASGQPDGYGRTVPGSVFDVPSGPLPRKYWNKKVYPEPAMQSATSNRQAGWVNQRILRFSDVLLMAAEAANELGGTENQVFAERYLNQVRNRAGLTSVAFASKDQMRNEIKLERRRELAMEGERFYDLVRWNDAELVLGSDGYTPCHKYYPIPQSAIDFAAGVLIQNPCW